MNTVKNAEKQDWIFSGDTYACGLRTAGVLIQNGCILLQRDAGGDEYALPGGHVQVGETTMQALAREWQEEMGVFVTCEKLLWTEECFFEWRGKQNHHLCFYYLIRADSDASLPETAAFTPHRDNPAVEVGWLPIDRLQEVTIYPAFIREEIHRLDAPISHHITHA